MLTAHEVLTTRFTPTKFRAGYDLEQVDAYLDRATTTLTALEAGEHPGAGMLSASEAREARFVPTKWREGYDVTEVDDLIDSIVRTLQAYESGAAQDSHAAAPVSDVVGQPDLPLAPAQPAAADAIRPLGIHDLTTQLQYARVRSGGSDRLVVTLPDGSTARVTALEAGPDGVTLRTAPLT